MLARLAGVAACALALTLAGATTAQAASRTFVDSTADVWHFGQAQPSQVPHRDQGDIARTTLTHGTQRVVVRTRFVELNRDGRILIFTVLRTNTGQVRGLALEATRNHYRGHTFFQTPRGVDQRCPAIRHHIDYANNVATVSVPRSCLGNPRTVQAKFGVATHQGQRGFADNPINDGPTENLPPYTAAVRVG